MIGRIIQRYRIFFAHKKLIWSSVFGLFAVAASLITNFYAGIYATEKASNPVTDIILSNTPVFNVVTPFIYGSVLLIIFIAVLCLVEPRRIPFITKSIALFFFTRAVFISLTHIGPFPTKFVVTSDFMQSFMFGADLFFSGHTGVPFLMALIFWDDPLVRNSFLGVTIFFAFVVLLGHLHYTIDVFAAFFITHTIYHMAGRLFHKDQKLFLTKLTE